MEDAKKVVAHRWCKPRKKLVGITDYINAHFPFTRPQGYTSGRGHSKGSDMGRRFGCKLDSMITRVVNSKPGQKKQSISREKPYMRKQVQFYLTFLWRAGLSPCKAQVYIQSEPHGVHTWMDLICIERSVGRPSLGRQAGALVIIENKTSQLKAADYMRVYKVPCTVMPVLSNGLPNTEYTRHQLQLGLAMFVLSKFKLRKSPKGYVIIHCKDRILRIPAAPWVLSSRMYPILSSPSNQ